MILLTVAMLSAFAAVALGISAPWGQAGGDAGQSGYQPVAEGALPIAFTVRIPPEPGSAVRTQPVIGAEDSNGEQALAYGKHFTSSSADDRNDFYIRRLDTGALRSTTDLDSTGADADPDGFGPAPGGVHPLTSGSSTGGPGVIYQLHNDDDSPAKTALECEGVPPARTDSQNDIALAWFDERTGAKLGDAAVGVALGCPAATGGGNPQQSDGFTIESAGVLGPPSTDGTGSRGLLFTGKRATGGTRMFRVNVTDAGAPSASPGTDATSFRDIAGLDTKVTPAIAYLEDPSGAPGVARSYALVAVAQNAGVSDVRAVVDHPTLTVEGGPEVPADVPGSPKAIAVPVTEDGIPPGQPGSGAVKATAVYVAYENAGNTTIRRFEQVGNDPKLTEVGASVPLRGAPAPGLAVTAEVVSGVQGAGKVVVATSANVFVLDSETLDETARLQDGGETEPDLSGTSGFTRTAPSASGKLIYLTRDDGTQVVLTLSDAEHVPSNPAGFQEHGENLNATMSIGRPALSNGYVAFVSDLGTWVYRGALNPQVTVTAPPPRGEVKETTTFRATVTDSDGTIDRVTFTLDGGSPFTTKTAPDTAGGSTYSATIDTLAPPLQDGTHTLTVTARDDKGTFGSEVVTFVINNFADPTARLTVKPTEARETGTVVTLDASGSTPTESESETIAGYKFDVDGDGTFELDNLGDPTADVKFATPGTRTVGVQVKDSNGDTSTATATVVSLNRPPVASFSGPTSAERGATVAFDASGSADPDGSIVRYEWDLDGNGSFETTATTPTVQKQFANAATLRIQLRVTDDQNATATIAKDVVVVGSAIITKPPVRLALRGLSLSLTPRSDKKRPYRFTAKGVLTRPLGVSASAGCIGSVLVTVKAGRRTISSRRAKLNSRCRYSRRFTFKDAKRFGKARSLRVQGRFGGNARLLPKRTSAKNVRVR